MHWIYNAKKLEELPKDVVAFVYIIYYTDDTMYVGSKLARSERKKNFGKKKLATVTDSRLKTYEMVLTEHKWREYEGSSKLTETKTISSKHILHLCTNKRSMTYLEVKELMTRQALETPDYINNNINGNWFDNCLDGLYIEPQRTHEG